MSRRNDRGVHVMKVSKVAKIRNRYNQVPHLTQDTNGKVTNSQKTPQTSVIMSHIAAFFLNLTLTFNSKIILIS